jgi:hypothetical protein
MIYGELGRFPLYIDIKTRVISYWCKLLTGKASKLSAISYKLLHSFFFCNGNISAPWVKFAKDILDNCGLSRYYSSFYIYVKWKAAKLAVYHKIWRALLQVKY